MGIKPCITDNDGSGVCIALRRIDTKRPPGCDCCDLHLIGHVRCFLPLFFAAELSPDPVAWFVICHLPCGFLSIPVPGIRIVKYRTIFCRFIGKSQFFQVIAVRCFSDCQYLDHCGCLMFEIRCSISSDMRLCIRYLFRIHHICRRPQDCRFRDAFFLCALQNRRPVYLPASLHIHRNIGMIVKHMVALSYRNRLYSHKIGYQNKKRRTSCDCSRDRPLFCPAAFLCLPAHCRNRRTFCRLFCRTARGKNKSDS